MKPNLIFFTYADRKYDFFAVPYAYFALKNNPEAIVEICFEDYLGFLDNQNEAVELLNKIFPDRFLFRQAESVEKYKGIIPNTVRFVEKAQREAEYLYIGDIDLLVFDDVLQVHLKLINDYKLPFSNIIRVKKNESDVSRLSGLHFVKYSDYYPLPNIDDMDLATVNDENFLFECMSRKGIMVPPSFQLRPECGIHMSLSRDPLGRSTGQSAGNFAIDVGTGWGGKNYYHKFLHQIKHIEFCELLSTLDLRFRQLILMLEAMIKEKHRMMHRMAASYLLDKRVAVSSISLNGLGDFYKKRDALMKEKKYESAIELGCMATLIWPNNIDIWWRQFYLYWILGRYSECAQTILHIYDLPSGREFLKSNEFIKSKFDVLKNNPELDKIKIYEK